MKISKQILGVIFITVVLIAGISAGAFFLYGNSTKNTTQAVAEVNGKKVSSTEFSYLFEQQKAGYGYSEDNKEQQESIKQLKEDVLDQLITRKLTLQKAEEAGFKVTDEILVDAKKEFDDILVNITEQMKGQGASSGEPNKDYGKEANDYVDSQLKAMGKTRDEFVRELAEMKVVEKFMDDLVKDVKCSDDDIKSYYDSQLKLQQDGTPAAMSGAVELLQPAESRVKHILIGLPEEHKNEYQKLASEGKQEEAKKYLEEKLNEIKPKAQEVLNKAKSGEDFEKLIEQYGEDPGMQSNKEGYTVRNDGQFIPEFQDASLKLKEGEISDLVGGPFGYHIIKAYEKKAERAFTLEEKKDAIRDAVENEKRMAFINEKIEEWKGAATIKKFEDRM
ncbi:MAG: SurA N-terminal domain-containing protein [Bacillota bacterium]